MTVEISTTGNAEALEREWRDFVKAQNGGQNAPVLGVVDEYSERAIDGGTTLSVVELSIGFVTGVGSGLVANWLTHVIQSSIVKYVRVGKTQISEESAATTSNEELLALVKAEIAELKARFPTEQDE